MNERKKEIIRANYDRLCDELAEMICDFDIRCNNYQTDVYMYIDVDAGTATLDTFVNVGGNSWLNDDHITIYRDTEHLDGPLDWYNDIDELAEYAGTTKEALLDEVRKYYDLDSTDDVDFSDAYMYIKQEADGYREKLTAEYGAALRADFGQFVERAKAALDETIRNLTEAGEC